MSSYLSLLLAAWLLANPPAWPSSHPRTDFYSETRIRTLSLIKEHYFFFNNGLGKGGSSAHLLPLIASPSDGSLAVISQFRLMGKLHAWTYIQ